LSGLTSLFGGGGTGSLGSDASVGADIMGGL
jgi:hypothetical protein